MHYDLGCLGTFWLSCGNSGKFFWKDIPQLDHNWFWLYFSLLLAFPWVSFGYVLAIGVVGTWALFWEDFGYIMEIHN